MFPITFTVEGADKSARAGCVTTLHGAFATPAFTVVGTKGTVKGITPTDLIEKLGVQALLANTYHLFLAPGEDAVAASGGLHNFMGWPGALITDSGGFQVFSLGAGFGKKISKFAGAESHATAPAVWDEEVATQHGQLAIVDDEGVSFTSHLNGSLHRFTPERSVEIQHTLGADIFFAFDECTSPDASYEYQKDAAERTHRWAKRSLMAHRQNTDAQGKQALLGIVQGGRYSDLRKWSAETIGAMDFDGFGIGGSFSKADLGDALAAAIGPLPPTKPRHLLGIGEPDDILEGVGRGIDMFDCVLPTRLGRTGTIYTKRGKIDLTRHEYIRDFSPLDVETGGYASEHFTKAYLSHLLRSKEMLGGILASMHNIHFILSLMRDIRQSILVKRFDEYRQDFMLQYQCK